MADTSSSKAASGSPQDSTPTLSWPKQLIFGLISVVIAFLALACVGEVALRVLPMGRYTSQPFRRYDPVMGVALLPNMKVVHSRGCFTGLVETNRWGFRDRDRTLEKPPGVFRIALMGDSAVEAVHVQPDQVMNLQMERDLQQLGYKNIEVMDFAVEGIGTTQELIMYKNQVRQFHPDLVVIMFSDNDVMNNSSTLQPKSYGIHTWYSPYYDLGPDGQLVFRPVEPRMLNGLRSFLEQHSVLAYYLERTWFKFDPTVYTWHGLPVYYGTYGDDPMDADWQQAWKITSKVMGMMKQTVEADGAKFAILTQASLFSIDPNWRTTMGRMTGKPIPPEFNPPKFLEHLQDAAAKANVQIDSLIPYMVAYRDEHHLQFPFYSLGCDPHYSALGHQVVAADAVQLLQKDGLLPPLAPNPQ
ncbi:MAG: SGNH/GDSL hydrolase family protein [Terriglobales bacterium]|jgi:lysophospholipase L1-like esterase